jgi:putative inorganic carbon (HCO3(-)) transporter
MQGIERSTRVALLGLAGALLAALFLAAASLNTIALASGGLLLLGVLLLYPETAVYFLVFAVPFGSLMPLQVGGANVTAADGLLLGAWGLYLARQVARRSLTVRVPPLALPFVIFILAAAISITVAQSLTDSISELTKWIEMLAAYWLVAQFFDATRTQRLLAVMFLAGLAEALLGAYQYYYQVGPEGFLLFGGANLRAYGTFEQPNPYAGYLGLMIPLAIGVVLGLGREVWAARAFVSFWRRIPLRQWLLMGLAIVSCAAMLAAMFFSYSRGAWVGAAVAASATVLLTLVRSRRAAMVGLLLLFLALVVIGLGQFNLVPDVLTERFAAVGDYFGFEDVRGVRTNDNNFAIVERWAHWQAALSMFEDSPWLGVGFGNYAVAYPKYSLPKWDDPLGHAHNYYLNVLAEAGVVGLSAFLLLWGAVFWRTWREVLCARDWVIGVAAGILGMLVALSIHNFFDNLFVHAMYIQVGLTLGIGAALAGSQMQHP